MAVITFSTLDQLQLLAAKVCDHLDDTYSESELELSDELAGLYNLAGAVLERDSANRAHSSGTAGDEHVQREFSLLVELAEDGRVGQEWSLIREALTGRAS